MVARPRSDGKRQARRRAYGDENRARIAPVASDGLRRRSSSDVGLRNINFAVEGRMKRSAGYLLLVGILALAVESQAADLSASKIIERYKKAVGGNAVKRVKSTLATGSLKTADGLIGRFTYQASAPESLRIDLEAGELKSSECFNGKSAWRLDGRGLRTLLGDEAKRLRLEAVIANSHLQELSRYKITPQLAVKTTLDGRDSYRIEFVKESASTRLFFDAKSNLIVKQERAADDGVEAISFSDYRAVDGVMEPFAIHIRRGANEAFITIDRITHNAVDQAAFRYPQMEGARPLPDLETLMKAIVANQEQIEDLREKYTFRELETEREVDNQGRTKEKETRTYEVTPVAGRFVRRLVSRNRKALSKDEQEREDRRVQQAVELALKAKQKRKQRAEERERRSKTNDDEPDDHRRMTILSFLKLSEVTSMRREMFRGHEVIAFDFEPKKNIKTRNRGEALVSKLIGTMWVDEAAQQIVRIEARLSDSFKVGGGLLASLSPQSAIVMEQEKVGGEVWLPSYAEANLAARVFLVAKFSRNVVTRYSDYKRVQIDSQYELNKPKDSKKPEKQP
jgi:hypothetical protein